MAVIFLNSAVLMHASASDFRFGAVDERLLEQSNQLDQKMEREGLIIHDASAQAFIDAIGARLVADKRPLEKVTYSFKIARDPMVNAFALPNGSIYVNTGLIAGLRDEGQLASVLSHEIIHVTERHTYLANRSIRKKNVAIDVLLAAAAAGGIRGGTAFGASVWVAAQVSEIFVVASAYGYSRELESDADRLGYQTLIHANYDGTSMAEAFEILDERIEFEPTQPFWRSHPKLEQRIAASKALALHTNPAHTRDPGESDYLGHFEQVIRNNIQLDLVSRRVRTAIDRAQRLIDHQPSDVQNTILLADAYRTLGARTTRPAAIEISPSGKKANRNRLIKRTPEEEQRDLLSLPHGKETLAQNRSMAESLYRRALETAPEIADGHRGLGMLYEEESRNQEAAREYLQYLSLAQADAPDRLRIERRLERIRQN